MLAHVHAREISGILICCGIPASRQATIGLYTQNVSLMLADMQAGKVEAEQRRQGHEDLKRTAAALNQACASCPSSSLSSHQYFHSWKGEANVERPCHLRLCLLPDSAILSCSNCLQPPGQISTRRWVALSSDSY